MAREHNQVKGPGSASKSTWDIMKDALLNQRGQVGIGGEEISPGADDAGEIEDTTISPEDQLSEESQESESTEEEEAQLEAEPQAEIGEGEEKIATKEETTVTPEFQELQNTVASLQGQLENVTRMAQFYQTQYNEIVGQGPEPKTIKPAVQDITNLPGSVDEELPPLPEAWESTQDAASYFDKRNGIMFNKAMNQRYEEHIAPMFNRANLAINALVEHLIKPSKEDWDDVIKGVNNEMFVLDPTGQNIVGFRNPGLLQYFQAQPLPILAMYEYGKSKKASKEVPEKIKQGIQKGTKETLKKITQKPRGPIKITSGKEMELPELDWETPAKDADRILASRGLIPK